MMEEYWNTLIGKQVRLCKIANPGFNYIYNGILVRTDENGILLKDIKFGNIFLSYDGLSVLKIGDAQ